MNKKINQLHQNLSYMISSSNLPIGIVYFIVKDLCNELEKVYKDFIYYQEEEEEENFEEEKEKKENFEEEKEEEEPDPIQFLSD